MVEQRSFGRLKPVCKIIGSSIIKANQEITNRMQGKSSKQQKTSVVTTKLATIGSLVLDKEKITSIRTNITNGNDWTGLSLKDDGTNTRLQLLKSVLMKWIR